MYVVKHTFTEDDGQFDVVDIVVFIGDETECDEYIASHPDEETETDYYYEKISYRKESSVPGMLWSDMSEVYPSTGKLTIEVDMNGVVLGNVYSYDFRHADADNMSIISGLIDE